MDGWNVFWGVYLRRRELGYVFVFICFWLEVVVFGRYIVE